MMMQCMILSTFSVDVGLLWSHSWASAAVVLLISSSFHIHLFPPSCSSDHCQCIMPPWWWRWLRVDAICCIHKGIYRPEIYMPHSLLCHFPYSVCQMLFLGLLISLQLKNITLTLSEEWRCHISVSRSWGCSNTSVNVMSPNASHDWVVLGDQ